MSANTGQFPKGVRHKPPKGKPFQKGQSGNPGGRKAMPKEVVELAREHTEAAMRTIIRLMDSKSENIALAAALAVLDRGHGKPAQAVTGEGGTGPVQIVVRTGVPRAGD